MNHHAFADFDHLAYAAGILLLAALITALPPAARSDRPVERACDAGRILVEDTRKPAIERPLPALHR